MKRVLLVAAFLLAVAGCDIIPGGQAATATTTFDIASRAQHSVAVQLQKGDTLEGTLSISGRENYLDFYVSAPDGGQVYGVVRVVAGQGFLVKANSSGTYVMHFDNSFSFGSPRQVALSYSVR